LQLRKQCIFLNKIFLVIFWIPCLCFAIWNVKEHSPVSVSAFQSTLNWPTYALYQNLWDQMQYEMYTLSHPEKSVVAKHNTEVGHNWFNSISVLGKVIGCMDHIVKEAIGIHLHPNNFMRWRLHHEPGMIFCD
jgi:hypothetical protein